MLPGCGLADHALDLGLLRVVELGAVGSEELDAVVGVGVVRGRDDRGEVEAEAADQHRGAGRGKHPAEQSVPAGGGDAGGQRGLEHLARLARVADDQDLRDFGSGDARRGAAEGRGELGREELAGDAAHAVGSEELAGAAPHCEAPAAVHRRL